MLIDPVTGNPSLAFTMYAAECEGDIPTHEGKKNRLKKTLRERPSWKPIDEDVIREEAAAAGLELTYSEIQNILYELTGY